MKRNMKPSKKSEVSLSVATGDPSPLPQSPFPVSLGFIGDIRYKAYKNIADHMWHMICNSEYVMTGAPLLAIIQALGLKKVTANDTRPAPVPQEKAMEDVFNEMILRHGDMHGSACPPALRGGGVPSPKPDAAAKSVGGVSPPRLENP